MLERVPAFVPRDRILFSHVAERLPPDRLARWMLDANIQARMQIQLHKVIWPERDRGV